MPIEVMSRMSSRASRRPLLILNELSISGSLRGGREGGQSRVVPLLSARETIGDLLDETLPSDCRSRLFKVDPHDHLEIGPPAIGNLSPQLGRILPGLVRVVDRARTDNDEQPVVLTVNDLGGGGSGLLDGLVGLGRGRNVVTQECRRNQRVVLWRNTG